MKLSKIQKDAILQAIKDTLEAEHYDNNDKGCFDYAVFARASKIVMRLSRHFDPDVRQLSECHVLDVASKKNKLQTTVVDNKVCGQVSIIKKARI